jgi:hypothetical protein
MLEGAISSIVVKRQDNLTQSTLDLIGGDGADVLEHLLLIVAGQVAHDCVGRGELFPGIQLTDRCMYC